VKGRETHVEALHRFEQLTLLQDHYRHFPDFLQDAMSELGFNVTDLQYDIASFMEHGPQHLMVQAQRGQAKTTIAAAFAVFDLIHNPKHRVLIVSAGGTQATEISTLIVRFIMTLDVLACMRPDKMAGDRASVEAFDVHHSLKGLDKSPSVACVGIGANLPGKRADLLIPDDVESPKNGMTPLQRGQLLHLTKEFTSICSTGRILWLGTPQTNESIYNSLPSRGVTIRVWPGRYPTPEQRSFYGNRLAPYIARRLDADPGLGQGGGMLSDQGQPTDPQLFDEDTLQRKELDQGTPHFQLQYMLNTVLADSQRFPLKPSLLVLLQGAGNRWPMEIVRGMDAALLRDFSVADFPFQLMTPHEVSRETANLQDIWACIDPAAGGANGDETAYAVAGFLNGNVILLSCGGLPGGYTEDKLTELAKRLARFKLSGVTIEKNMGYGAFAAVFTPILRKHITCQIDEDLVTGQKERRIIDTLSPVMGRGSLIVHPDVLQEDADDCMRYAPGLRQNYSLFFQLARMTLVRDALLHDDRADAVEAVVRHFQAALAQDQHKKLQSQRDREHREMLKDPLGYGKTKPGDQRPNMLRRWRK
jgi:hypothetical protein